MKGESEGDEEISPCATLSRDDKREGGRDDIGDLSMRFA